MDPVPVFIKHELLEPFPKLCSLLDTAAPDRIITGREEATAGYPGS
jgi:hypothetical protein